MESATDTDQRPQRRFIVGASVEFIGILTLAAAFGAKWGGRAAIALGVAAIVLGAGLQISAFLRARRTQRAEDA